MTLETLYIITESEKDNKETYRIIDHDTGKIRDVPFSMVQEYNVPYNKAQRITLRNLDKYTGKLLRGVNDFETWCRLNDRFDLLEEYDTNKNPKTTYQITKGCIDRVWWKCRKCGHEFETFIKARTTGTQKGCPECAFKEGRYHILREGVNDFETFCNKNGLDFLLQEYSDKNTIRPNEIASRNSTQKVWWVCQKCGREYKSLISNRLHGSGCKFCNKGGSSVSELTLYYALEPYFKEVLYRHKIDGYEADIYIPEIQTIIDYRALYWHKDLDKFCMDAFKEMKFEELGIRQITILSDTEYKTEIQSNDIITHDEYDFTKLINLLYSLLKIDKVLDKDEAEKIRFKALSNKNSTKIKNSVAETHPEILKKWDFEKNGTLTPYAVTAGCKYKAYFKCDKGHSYYSPIRKQANGQGCPICNGTETYKGINDLKTLYPEAVNIWDFEKNNEIGMYIDEVRPTSGKKAYFKCPVCGESYYKQIYDTVVGRRNVVRCKNCKTKFFKEQEEIK